MKSEGKNPVRNKESAHPSTSTATEATRLWRIVRSHSCHGCTARSVISVSFILPRVWRDLTSGCCTALLPRAEIWRTKKT